MKKIMLMFMAAMFSLAAKTQDTLSTDKKIKNGEGQKGHLDYFLEIDGVKGESKDPDTLPPSNGHLSLSAGGTLSQTRNSNFIDRYSTQARPGFMVSLAYAWEFAKGRLNVAAGYQKGGVRVAVGDVTGDGRGDVAEVGLDYISLPVQYQFYLGKSRRFFLGGGGYASFLLSSKQKVDKVYENDIRKFDAGVMASAGMWISPRLVVQSGYHAGLIDIDPARANKARNGMAFLVLSYSLTHRIKYGPIIKIKPKGG